MYCVSSECTDKSCRETDDKARFDWDEDSCWKRSGSQQLPACFSIYMSTLVQLTLRTVIASSKCPIIG